jgi:hypothetical protein
MEEITKEKVLHGFDMHQHIPLNYKCALCGLFLMKHMQGDGKVMRLETLVIFNGSSL